ncbi:replication fork protection component Swi3 domain-containing protein [Trichoderma austrokoningii]
MSSSKRLPAHGDDLDDYDMDDYGMDDFDMGDDLDNPFASPTRPSDASNKKRKEPDSGLGIDEEISLQKRMRAPNAKLDEERLLSLAGIPKLRERAARLNFKGKGHEFSDASLFLACYQLWLDGLFPKARFLDALAIIEKAGHKKALMAARDQMINEGRPRANHDDDDDLYHGTPRKSTKFVDMFGLEAPATNDDDVPNDDDLPNDDDMPNDNDLKALRTEVKVLSIVNNPIIAEAVTEILSQQHKKTTTTVSGSGSKDAEKKADTLDDDYMQEMLEIMRAEGMDD